MNNVKAASELGQRGQKAPRRLRPEGPPAGRSPARQALPAKRRGAFWPLRPNSAGTTLPAQFLRLILKPLAPLSFNGYYNKDVKK